MLVISLRVVHFSVILLRVVCMIVVSLRVITMLVVIMVFVGVVVIRVIVVAPFPSLEIVQLQLLSHLDLQDYANQDLYFYCRNCC